MSTDPRGFAYGLEPVRRRRQWLLDAAQARLGRIESALAEARDEQDRVTAQHEAAQHEAAQALQGQLDPARHRRALAWIAWQRSEIARIETEIAALDSDRDAARRDVLASQLKCDLIEAHRAECFADFVQDAQRRAAVEADRDWLMREASIRLAGGNDTMEVLP
jgi:hypothetical protein